jgi:FMN phosphatase YigB (HAD superfamily)
MGKPYRVVLFDCFNTLFLSDVTRVPTTVVDGKPAVSTAGLLKTLIAPDDPEITEERIYRAHRQAWIWAEGERGERCVEVSAHARFRRILTLLGIEASDDAFVTRLLDAHIGAVTASYDLPEAHRALLERLAPRRRLAIFSNFDYAPGLRRLLVKHAVEARFDPVVISAEIGLRKPGRAAFERALSLVGEPPERILFVGDSLSDDVGGAAAMGLDVAWLNLKGEPRGDDHPRPTYELRALGDIESLLD